MPVKYKIIQGRGPIRLFLFIYKTIKSLIALYKLR